MNALFRSTVAVVILLVLANSFFGCGNEERHALPVEQGMPEGEVGGERLYTAILTPGDHDALMRAILGDTRVRICESMFAAHGLQDKPISSFSVRGMSREGNVVTATLMVFAGPDSSQAGVLAYLDGYGSNGDRKSMIRPCLVRSVGGKIDAKNAVLSMMECSVAASADSAGEGGGGGYWHCVGISAIGGTITCTLKCLPAGPLYADCLIACAGWSVLSALIGCAFSELFSGAN